jgi:MarR family transcriptional regulator, organic hydroperoxide resistance regulator
MVVPLGRALVNAEVPVLREHGLTMWAYAVLAALAQQPMRTQAALAQAIGADKTRIISVLDELQARALIQRAPDPRDRRARLLSLTPKGQVVHHDAQVAIRKMEEQVLDAIPQQQRRTFLDALQSLYSSTTDRNRS